MSKDDRSPAGWLLYKLWYGKDIVYLGRTQQPLMNRLKVHCFKDAAYRSIDVNKLTKIEYTILPTQANMFIYEIYYINKYKGALNVDDKAKDSFTEDIVLPELEWNEYKCPNLLDGWRIELSKRDSAMFKMSESRARAEYTKHIKEKFKNGEISEEEYIDFKEQMRTERKAEREKANAERKRNKQ